MTATPIIAERIQRLGPMRFSEYMDVALYHTTVGFYATGGAGRRRDFITSPEVGPLFGQVISNMLDGWWDELGQPDPFLFVEAGAGPGTLARSVLGATPRCGKALRYVAVETSERQRAQHPDSVTSLTEMPDDIGVGVVFANELLDNLPFDILEFDPRRGWLEVRVGLQEGTLCEVLIPTGEEPIDAAGVHRSFRVPIQRRAANWLAETVGSLHAGRVVVVDYAIDQYPSEPGREWLRTYAGHARGALPLADPGSQDITADVDIASLSAVRRPSLEVDQASWLRGHGIDALVAEGRAYWNTHAAAPSLAAFAMRSRVHEAEALLDPAGLGAFVVLEWSV